MKRLKLKSSTLEALLTRWREGSFGEMWEDWKWIFSYSARFKGQIILYTLLGVFSSSLGLVSAVAGKFLVDVVTGRQTDKLWIAALVMAGSALSGVALSSVTGRLTRKLDVDMTNAIRRDVFDRVMDAGWQSLNRYSNGDMLNRFHGDIGSVSSNAISWLPSAITSVYSFFATFAVIWHYSPTMSLIALSSAPVILLMSRYLMQKQRDYREKMQESTSELYSFETEALYNLDTVKSFGIMNYFSLHLGELQAQYRRLTLSWNMFQIRTSVFMSIMGLVVEYISYGYCLFLLWTSRISYGTMVLFLEQRTALSGTFQSIVALVPSLISGSVSAHRIRELMELPPEKHHDGEIPAKFQEGRLTLRLADADFRYEDGARVIKSSNFEARPGQITALVGPSGEGKTTVLRLLLGIVEPEAGSCCFYAPDGEVLPVSADSRRLIAYVPQGNTLLSGTIAENMRLAKPDATDAELIAALDMACAWDFVEKMPEGVNSSIYSRGKGLSEGQAQRIAIARALLRKAPVLLMDEATSALDVKTERAVLRSILQKAPDRTCVITTHRPTVLSMCDKVYRVVDGEITQLNEQEITDIVRNF